MAPTLEDRCRTLVADIGIGDPSAISAVEPLAGGVASDIARVDLDGRSYCAKFALPKLKVQEDWRAPVHRNKAEYAWLLAATTIVPESVPRLYGRSERENGFMMEFLDGPDIRLWKTGLLLGTPEEADAVAVADLLGRMHASSTMPGFDSSPFRNRDDFRALRLEPYLSFTAARHPELAPNLNGLTEALYLADTVLVHGDVSPKNIFLRRGVPILLDAECATMGDASFDVAFCINHLVLKAVHRPEHAAALLGAARAFWPAYAGHVTWESTSALEARVAALLPALMLARVDGKSPVEYLNVPAQAMVRALSIPAIVVSQSTLEALLHSVEKELFA